ncbi:MAG: non-homologous end-joining DNA ligase [Simkaniaceae bacterium]
MEFANLDKVFFPKKGITKGDLLAYYKKISPYLLPFLKDRGEVLHRFPDGIQGDSFYQKNVDLPNAPTASIRHSGKTIRYLIVQDLESLLYMVNLGCIEVHPISARVANMNMPDYMVLDLDPVEIGFDKVQETALAFYDLLTEVKISGFPKTSGGNGIHIYVPMEAKYPYEAVKDFAYILCRIIHDKMPQITSLERDPKKRRGKIYLDYLQNRWGASMAAPYSVRPNEEACVSTPLLWKELEKDLSPRMFRIDNILPRIKEKGDIFHPVLEKGISIEKSLKNMQSLKVL